MPMYRKCYIVRLLLNILCLHLRLRHIGAVRYIKWIKNYNQPYHFEDEGIMHTLAYRLGLKNHNRYILEQKWCWCSFLPNPENAGFIHIRTKVTPKGPKREKMENYNELVSKGVL